MAFCSTKRGFPSTGAWPWRAHGDSRRPIRRQRSAALEQLDGTWQAGRRLDHTKVRELLGFAPDHDFWSTFAAALAIRGGRETDVVPTGVRYGGAAGR